MTYTLSPALPSKLSFDATLRTISGTPTSTSTSATYTYTASADGYTDATLTFSVAVAAPAPTLSFTTSAIANQSYTKDTAIDTLNLPAATGGSGTTTYALAPDLPAGLSFDATARTISGTPTAASASASYTYSATDGTDIALLFFSIEVAELAQEGAQAASAWTLNPSTISDKTWTTGTSVGTVYLPKLQNNGTDWLYPDYTLSPSLPSGLTFTNSRYDSAAPTITGTPSAGLAETTFTFTGDNFAGGGGSVTITFKITVNQGSLAFSQASIPNQTFYQHAPVNFQLPAVSNSGVTGVTYSLSGTLPAGLSFDAGTRKITGTPTATMPATTFTYTASHATYVNKSLSMTMSVGANSKPSVVGTGFGSHSQDIDSQSSCFTNSMSALITDPNGHPSTQSCATAAPSLKASLGPTSLPSGVLPTRTMEGRTCSQTCSKAAR